MDIIKYKKIYLVISTLLVAASIASILVFGFNQGIDFVGGALWQVKISGAKEELQALLPEAVVSAQPNTESFLIKLKEVSEEEHQTLLNRLKETFPDIEELRFESIGPAIGQELRRKSLTAFALVLLAISLYVAFAFRKVSQPVSSWKYGVVTLVTLFHDAVIPIGTFTFLSYLLNVEIDTAFVVAVLVIIGFSVHDTIVVFDRIRENLHLQKTALYDFNNLVNKSVKETLARSINTSATLIFVLLTLFFLGAPSLYYFVLAILIGTAVGTYSSIFVAAPLLTLWRRL